MDNRFPTTPPQTPPSAPQNQPESFESVPTNPAKKSIPNPVAFGVIGVVVFVVAIVGGYIVTQDFQTSSAVPVVQTEQNVINTPTQTSTTTVGWQTYQNDKYGFQFQYRPDWVADEEQTGSLNFSVYIHVQNEEYPGNGITVNITRGTSDATISDILSNGIEIISKATKTINGHQWTSYHWNNPADGLRMYSVYTEQTGYLYSLAGLESDDLISDIETIVQNFKFTNSNSVDTSTWKTYRDANGGFELKYPENGKVVSSIGGYVLINFPSESDYNLTLSIQSVPKGSDLQKAIFGQGLMDQRTIMIDGVPGIKATSVVGEDDDSLLDVVAFLREGYLYKLFLNKIDSNSSRMFDQIVSSFKFVPSPMIAFCSQKRDGCPASAVVKCKSSTGEELYKVAFCPDQPERYLNSAGVTIAECGGMPLPIGGTYKSSSACKNITCSEKLLIECKQ